MMINRLIRAYRLPTLFWLGFFSFQLLQAQSVANARAQALGSTVTVRGIVTTGDELGKIRYLQDGTAGIAVYPGTGSVSGFDGAVFPGDSIVVTGTLVSFHELLEITPITAFSIISSGHPLPAPKPISVLQISEEFESQRVELECIAFNSAGGVFNSGGNYTIHDSDGNSAKMYLRSGHPMLGSSIPAGPIRLQSVLSAYDEFQLLPSTPADLIEESCLFFVQKLIQTNINTNGFQLNWETSLPTNCVIHLGTSPDLGDQVPVSGNTSAHEFLLTNLQPGTIYWVQVEAQHNGLTIFSPRTPFATRSLSSGQIKTFFNHSIDPDFAMGLSPNGQTSGEVLTETIDRINAATQTLDVAMYNNNRSDLTNALKAAHARGVRVRYVGSEAASNVALDPLPPFPVLLGNPLAIMHNKFLVIDVDIPDKAWVMSGSLNWTSQNINTDFNNTLFIQDQSLARCYEIEFEEMWGGSDLFPDLFKSRFGAEKLDNTPHQFIIGGQWVESYFSPSDQTTSHIESTLRSAQNEALFAAFSFTKNELGNALVDVHDANVPVRGIMENISDNGAEYNHLLANGVAVKHHNLTGEFHHKYGVVDAQNWNSDPTVVTGSHNWSVSAETINDENTLILHDPVLAILFKAEFEKRWGEFTSGTQTSTTIQPNLFPNPGQDDLELRGLPAAEATIWVKNTLGQVLQTQTQWFEQQAHLDISGLKPGHYFVTYSSAHAFTSIPFQKI